jgi:hypothetical protein
MQGSEKVGKRFRGVECILQERLNGGRREEGSLDGELGIDVRRAKESNLP